MSNARRQILLNIFKLFDLGLMTFAFVMAALPGLQENRSVSFAEFFSMRIKIANLAIFALLIFSWYFIFNLLGLYRSRRFSTRGRELKDVVKAVSVAALVILAGAIAFHIRMVTPLFLASFWLASAVTMVGSRLILRVVLAWVRRHGRNLRDILIVGSNERVLEFCREIEARPDLGYRVIGFVDEEWSGVASLREAGHPVVSDFNGLTQFLRNNVVDEVVLALPMQSLYSEASRIATLCEEQGITVRWLSNIFNLRLAKPRAEQWAGDPLITHATGFAEGWSVVAKRILDLAISCVVLMFLAPVLAVAAIAIKLTSPGPVFFFQNRVGLNKRRFKICKFRTMVVDAEKEMAKLQHLNEVSGPVFKIMDDPRITPLGRFLRKTSIDELPQLFNVLKGDMSLVGPRPLPVRDYEGFSKDWQRRRFSVRPGITCLWQINGRSSIPFEKWMELDLEYIDGWSLWLDLQILVRTIPAVLRGSGAA
jgi:exopolysaccharide biosynthesis polyprenyl glycosylphosphotransferase